MGLFFCKAKQELFKNLKIHTCMDVIMNFNPYMFKYCKFAAGGLQNQNSHKLIFSFWL